MGGSFRARLRCVAVGLLVLAMLIVPFTASTASVPAGVLSGPCGCGAGTAGAEPATADGAMERTCCPGPDGASAPGGGCMAPGCHAMPVSLPVGAPPLPVDPTPASIAMPAPGLPDGIAVDPALKPPRFSI
ncbi:hypothetical protein GAY29_15255 [Azospirillum brasilense]|nr:hypothetical protein [Azospirillum brasilense]MBK3734432.1 hypothetical protein [Azospirillum brasilense]